MNPEKKTATINSTNPMPTLANVFKRELANILICALNLIITEDRFSDASNQKLYKYTTIKGIYLILILGGGISKVPFDKFLAKYSIFSIKAPPIEIIGMITANRSNKTIMDDAIKPLLIFFTKYSYAGNKAIASIHDQIIITRKGPRMSKHQ